MAISVKKQKMVPQNGSLRVLSWTIWARIILGYLVNMQISWLVPDFLMQHLWGNFKHPRPPPQSKPSTRRGPMACAPGVKREEQFFFFPPGESQIEERDTFSPGSERFMRCRVNTEARVESKFTTLVLTKLGEGRARKAEASLRLLGSVFFLHLKPHAACCLPVGAHGSSLHRNLKDRLHFSHRGTALRQEGGKFQASLGYTVRLSNNKNLWRYICNCFTGFVC